MYSEGVPGRGCTFSILIRKDQAHSNYPVLSPPVSSVSSQHQEDIEANISNIEQVEYSETIVTGNSFNWNAKSNKITPINSPRSRASSPRETDPNSLSRVHLSGELGINLLSNPRVALCVDDSAMSRKLIGKYLENYFEVIYATDGLEALEVVRNSMNTEEEIDIIFMDSQMPVMDGLEATYKIRDLGYKKPIIGITGNCEPEQIKEFIAQGANKILQKPVQLGPFGKVIVGEFFSIRFLS